MKNAYQSTPRVQSIRNTLLSTMSVVGVKTIVAQKRHKALSQLDAVLARRASFHTQHEGSR